MKRLRPFDAAIFDLDGTLLDSEWMYTEATERVLVEFGHRYDWALKQTIIGRGVLDAAERLVEALSLPISAEEYIRRRKPHLDRLFPTVQALPGAVAVVEALFAAAVPLAVATSSTRELFDQKLRHHGWAQRFRVVVCGDDPRLTRQKPAPDIFLLAAAELGVPPERCLVFEDSPTGVEAAKAAGTQVVAIPNEAVDVGLVASADLVIRRFAELEL